MTQSALRSSPSETVSADRAHTSPPRAITQSLQILDRAATRIEQQRHQLSAVELRATRAEAIAATSVETIEALKTLLTQALDEVALQREQIGAMQSRSEREEEATLTMILDLREKLAAAERRSPRESFTSASFTVGGDDGRASHGIRPN